MGPLLAMAGRVGATAAAEGGTYAMAAPAVTQNATKVAAESMVKTSQAAGDGLKSLAGKTDHVAESAKKASQDFQQLKGELQSVQGKVSGMISGVAGGITSHVTGVMTAAATSLKAFADPIAELVALANPAAVQQFTLAFRDTMAVMGRAMLPLMNSLTKVMRGVGDQFARVEPLISAVSEKIGAVVEDIFAAWFKEMEENAPFIEAMGDAIVTVAKAAAWAAKGIMRIGENLMAMLKPVMELMGYTGAGKKASASSMGAAVRDVKTTSSAEDISKSAIEKAMMQSLNGGKEKKDPVVEALNPLAELVRLASEYLPNMPTKEDIERFIRELPGKLREGAGNFVTSNASKASPGMGLLGNLLASALTR